MRLGRGDGLREEHRDVHRPGPGRDRGDQAGPPSRRGVLDIADIAGVV
jgi:hypothetical protein